MDQSMTAQRTGEATPLFELDDIDARRVEQLFAAAAAIETELSMIFSRAMKSHEAIQVRLRPSSPRVIGGKPVGYVVSATPAGLTCGFYDDIRKICIPIDCSRVPE